MLLDESAELSTHDYAARLVTGLNIMAEELSENAHITENKADYFLILSYVWSFIKKQFNVTNEDCEQFLSNL